MLRIFPDFPPLKKIGLSNCSVRALSDFICFTEFQKCRETDCQKSPNNCTNRLAVLGAVIHEDPCGWQTDDKYNTLVESLLEFVGDRMFNESKWRDIFLSSRESSHLAEIYLPLLEEITKADHDKPDWVEMCSSWDWALVDATTVSSTACEES